MLPLCGVPLCADIDISIRVLNVGRSWRVCILGQSCSFFIEEHIQENNTEHNTHFLTLEAAAAKRKWFSTGKLLRTN